jgi:hypothetical protein
MKLICPPPVPNRIGLLVAARVSFECRQSIDGGTLTRHACRVVWRGVLMQQRLALALAGLCILAAGCSSTGGHAATTPTTVPLVAEPALSGLLLSAAEVNTAVGGTDLSVTGDATDMVDHGASVSRHECLAIFSPGEANAYARSGWTAFREQNLADPGRTRWAVQSVVLFPTAEQAAAFFTASSTNWRKCDGSFVNILSGGREVWSVGPISEANGVLSTDTKMHLEVYDNPKTQENGGSTGQRVLTVRNNVVIDVAATSAAPNDSAAVKIAEQIAAKVPKA